MERILVIEDEEYYGEFLSKIVGKKYPCEWAKSGEEAKTLLQKNPYDIILYDLRLPGASGRDLIRYVKESVDPNIVNIVITGFEDDWPPVEATEEHIFFYLKKGDFKPEELLKVLENAVDLRQLRRREADFVKSFVAAEKLASAGKLAVSIAHEINNPLQGMMSILDVLKKKTEGLKDAGGDGTSFIVNDLAILERSIERIRKVVQQLTELHGIDYAFQGTSPLNAVAERVVSFIRPIAREKHIRISFHGSRRSESVTVSERQFFHVLLNTCMNLLDGNYESIDLTTGKTGDLAVLKISTVKRKLKKPADASTPDLFETPQVKETPSSAEGVPPRSQSPCAADFEITKDIIQSLHGSLDVRDYESGETITITFPIHSD